MKNFFQAIKSIVLQTFSTKKNIIIASAIASVVLATSTTLAIVQPHNCEKHYEVVSAQEATCTQDGVEVYQCKKCEKTKEVTTPKLNHAYELVSTSQATCTEDGTEVFTCSRCSDTYSNVIEAKKEHNYVFVEETLPASCTTDGKALYQCEMCKQPQEVTVPKLGHSYNKVSTSAPTCTEAGVTVFTCSTCSDTYQEIEKAKGHNYEVISLIKPTCTTKGQTTYSCTQCAHTYMQETEIVAEHNYQKLFENPATCTEEGTTYNQCSNCLVIQTVSIPALGHSIAESERVDATCTSAGYVKYACTRRGCTQVYEEILPIIDHVYVLIFASAANCTEDGKEVFSCRGCGDTYENVPEKATGHAYEIALETKASCTTAGETTYSCSRCKDSYTVETEKAKGHNYEVVLDVKASCTTAGEVTYSCSRCKDSYTEETEKAKGHAYEIIFEIKVSCTTDGKITYSCSRCKEGYTEDTEKATGHTYGKTLEIPATCTSTGYVKYSCTNQGCVDSYDEILPIIDHNYEVTYSTPASCTEDGIDRYTCSGCKASYDEVTEKAKGHDYEVVLETPPSCLLDGKTFYRCTRCKDGYEEKNGDATGHNYVETFQNPPPSCAGSGLAFYECSYCKGWNTEVIPPLGHDIGESKRQEPACTVDGYVRYTCQREGCLYGYEEVLPQLNHAAGEYASIFNDCVCIRCDTVLQPKLDNELGINYYLGFSSIYHQTPIYSQDRTGYDLGSYDYYTTPECTTQITFSDQISLQDFYSHDLLTSKVVTTENGKRFSVDGGFSVLFDFKTINNEQFDLGEMNIQKYSDFAYQFESDSMLMLVKEEKSIGTPYYIYEVVDFAHSTIEIARLIDGKYVTVATVNNPESWDAVWELDNIILSDKNGKMFSEAGKYRIMFKFTVAWFIESLNGKIYDASGTECYPYGIINDQYDYFYVTVTDDTYNILVPDDVDESRDLFYQISLDDIQNGVPFVKSGESVKVNDNIDIVFDSKIGNWNGATRYNGQLLTSWTMDFALYDALTDSYVTQASYNLFESLPENGVGKVKISKSNQIGDCKISVGYTLQNEETGEVFSYVDVYYLSIS